MCAGSIYRDDSLAGAFSLYLVVGGGVFCLLFVVLGCVPLSSISIGGDRDGRSTGAGRFNALKFVIKQSSAFLLDLSMSAIASIVRLRHSTIAAIDWSRETPITVAPSATTG